MKILVPTLLVGMLFFGIKYPINSTKTDNPTTIVNTSFPPFAVVELFTSEGCSSCPPADDLLRGYAKQPNVYVLGYHVTYWNRLGWKDIFSQKIFDERQYTYGNIFKLNNIYTPQAVINGCVEMVGSNKKNMETAIKNALQQTPNASIHLVLNKNEDKIQAQYTLSGDFKNSVLNIAIIEKTGENQVKSGENEGKMLKHVQIVKHLETLEISASTEGVTTLPKNLFENIQNPQIIAFLQDKNTFQIKAATSSNF